MNVKVITASAGSGKTFRLSQILDEALSDGSARPECIIATTFTRQAAAELSERARSRLLRGGKTQDAHKLLAARIGTVNSVCGSLATDFAFELGLSPGLRVIDENGAGIELKRALAAVITTDIQDQVQRYVSRFAMDLDWSYEVRSIIEAARANGLTAADLERCGQRSIADLDACLGKTSKGEAITKGLERAIDEALASIDMSFDTTKRTGDYVTHLRDARKALRRGRATWGAWAKLSSDKPAKKSLEFAAPVQAAASRHIEHGGLRDDMHSFIRLIFALAADGLQAYQKHKKQIGVIDYGDQESLALEILGNAQVRAELAEQIDLVLIDEFQDTSPLQLAIFLQLASIAKKSVWVGDPKQAIFAFRGTDPALMDAAIESLTSVATDPDLVTAATGAIAPAQHETLSTSYRSRPGLVRSTSDIFARGFASHGMPEERTRLSAALEQDPEGMSSDYEYWRLETRNKDQRASAVAGGVRELLASKALVRDKETGATHPVNPGDIAVLCRTNAQCREAADALVALGLTPVLPSMGVFDTAEGQLLLAGLRLWVDPGDAVSAATIARLCVYPGDLDAFVDRAIEVKGARAFGEVDGVARLLAHREAHKDLGLREVLDAVLTHLDARRFCAAWGDSAQRLANLDAVRHHLVGYAAQAESRGEAHSVVGFLQFIADMLDDWGWKNARADSKATIGGEHAITVSTWHRSKGLEWPVTILFGLESIRQPAAYGVHVLSTARQFDVHRPLADRWIRYWPNVYTNSQQKGPVRVAMEQTDSYAELVGKASREALRVLYVGWTRARDQLILAVQKNMFCSGLLGKLEEIDPALIAEPDTGATAISWAGSQASLRVRALEEVAAVERTPVAGTVTIGRKPEEMVAARQSPSSASAITCDIAETIELGSRLPIKDRADMEFVGNAVHAFLAADRTRYDRSQRLAIAENLLRRSQVDEWFAGEDVIEAADRLWSCIDRRFPGAQVLREWPLAYRMASGTMVTGTADLLLRTAEGFVVIDHKTFPGSPEMAKERARSYSGQLQSYSDAVVAVTGEKVASMWIHFPVLGIMTQVIAKTGTPL